VAFGDSYNDEERCVLAGYDNGDIKLFDLKMNKVGWPGLAWSGLGWAGLGAGLGYSWQAAGAHGSEAHWQQQVWPACTLQQQAAAAHTFPHEAPRPPSTPLAPPCPSPPRLQVRWETNVKNGVCGVAFDRRDIKMNKFVATCLEAQLHVYDARTQHPKQVWRSRQRRRRGELARVACLACGSGTASQQLLWLCACPPEARALRPC
jgi:hypothetical protein